MADEMIDLYDENNKPINKRELKSVAHATGLWHRVVSLWICSKDKKLLLQLRSKQKKLYPNIWHITGGHCAAGSTQEKSALAELEEELGVKLRADQLELFTVYKSEFITDKAVDREHEYCYLVNLDLSPEEYTLQEEEVAEVKYISITEFEEDLKNNPQNYAQAPDYWKTILSALKQKINE